METSTRAGHLDRHILPFNASAGRMLNASPELQARGLFRESIFCVLALSVPKMLYPY